MTDLAVGSLLEQGQQGKLTHMPDKPTCSLTSAMAKV